MPLHQEKRYTADEYFVLTPQTSERTELIGGKIVTQTASEVIHQDIAGGIYAEIRQFIRNKKGNCKPFIAPFDVKLTDDTVVQPDVLVVCDTSRLDDKRCYGAPDFIAEIVSSNRFDDYNRKLELYKLSGVREYWVIDPIERKTTVFTFEDTVNISFYPFETPVPVNIYKSELSIVIADLL